MQSTSPTRAARVGIEGWGVGGWGGSHFGSLPLYSVPTFRVPLAASPGPGAPLSHVLRVSVSLWDNSVPLNEMARQSLVCRHFCLASGGIGRLREGGRHMRGKLALQPPAQSCCAEGQGAGCWAAGSVGQKTPGASLKLCVWRLNALRLLKGELGLSGICEKAISRETT